MPQPTNKTIINDPLLSSTGRMVIDETRAHLTVSLNPRIPRPEGTTYQTEPHYDGHGLYYTKKTAYHPDTYIGDEEQPTKQPTQQRRQQEEKQQVGIAISASATISPSATHRLNKEYAAYAAQQQHFSQYLPSISLPDSNSKSNLSLTHPSTSYAHYGSHYRLNDSSTSSPATIIRPASLHDNTTKRVMGVDRDKDGSVQSDQTHWKTIKQISYTEPSQTNIPDNEQSKGVHISSAHGLGYGPTHPHYHTHLIADDLSSNASSSSTTSSTSAPAAESSPSSTTQHLAPSLGYGPNGHPAYYKYIHQKYNHNIATATPTPNTTNTQ